MKTPEQIADQIIERNYEDQGSPDDYPATENLNYLLQHGEVDADGIHALLAAAIEADRAQRTPLEDWAHNVAALMADDKSNDWREEIARLMVITGEADDRIAELTAAWEDATGDTAANYVLSEDDWRAGLGDEEAAEIARLIEWRDAQ